MRFTMAEVRASFDATTLVRGLDYASRGAVVRLDFDHDGDVIKASVRGSASVPYELSISLYAEGHRLFLEGDCDCPVGDNCKHAAAAAIEAARCFSSGQVEAATQPVRDPNEGVVERWLDALRAYRPGRVHAVPHGKHLRYLIDIRDTPYAPNFELAPMVTTRLKSGLLGAPRRVEFANIAYGGSESYTPSDRTIARLANSAGISGYGASPSPTILAVLLEQILATGRLHWRSLEQPELSPRALEGERITWTLDADGRQRPRLDGRPAARLVPSNPVWYVDPERAEAGPVELGVDSELARLIVSAPSLTAQQAKRAQSVWHLALSGTNVAAPHSSVRTEIVERNPVPVLALSAFPMPPKIAHIEPLGAMAELTFAYGARTIRPGDEVREFQEIAEELITVWPRRMAFEQAALAELAARGLAGVTWPHVQFIDRASSIFRFNGSGERRWAHFLDAVVPVLREAGWQIEIAPDFPYAVVRNDDVDAELTESENHWFELDLGITVEGERIPLLPIVVDALRTAGIRSAGDLAELGADARVYGRLPNGNFVSLAPERVEQILSTLVELFDVPLSEGRLPVGPGHLASLEQLERTTPLRWAAAQPLRDLIRSLGDESAAKPLSLPTTFKGELRPYQAKGVAWLQLLRRTGFGGVLADDMGLGKTVQILAHLAIERTRGRLRGPVLVVAPTSVVPNWRAECARFLPRLRVLTLTGADRAERFDAILESDLVLTTYALLHRDAGRLLAQEWQVVVLDEAQAIKNPNSKGAQIATGLRAQQRLALTGTPMENHLDELWSIFSFAVPGLLGGRAAFGRVFRTPIEKRGDAERRTVLALRLRPFLLRRTKDAVAPDLPEKTEIVQRIELEGGQRDLYETIRLAMHAKVRAELQRRSLARSRIVVLDALLKLRQVCCDPRLVKLPAARNVRESRKLEALFEMLPELLEEGRRVLLFSQFTSMLDLIKIELATRGIDFVEIRGDTADRVTPVQRFQAGEVPLFLISLKAGGTGLNLTAADTVIHYDPWWNPAVERQATDRAHRIGQHQPVFVYKLITAGTVEERILDMQQRKGELAAGVFDASAALSLEADDIENLFAPL